MPQCVKGEAEGDASHIQKTDGTSRLRSSGAGVSGALSARSRVMSTCPGTLPRLHLLWERAPVL
jgi:hypothetical protein